MLPFKGLTAGLTIVAGWISITPASAAEARVNQVYHTNCTTCKLQQQSVTISTVVVSNSNFRFISANPGDAAFTGNDLNGTLVYTNQSNVTVTIYGTISRTVKAGNTQLGVFFAETNNTYTTLTGQGYVLVIPGQEANLAPGQSYNTASDPMDQVLNDPILPALGLNLKVQRSGQAALLNWSVLSEKNTAKYVVERSTDCIRFAGAGDVNASGFSNSPRNYQFSDQPGASQPVFYRVRLVDADGKQSISNIVSINFSQSTGSSQLYPNPAREQAFLSFGKAGTFHVDLLNFAGKLLWSETVSAASAGATTSINRGNLPNGIYMIRISDDRTGSISSHKLAFNR